MLNLSAFVCPRARRQQRRLLWLMLCCVGIVFWLGRSETVIARGKPGYFVRSVFNEAGIARGLTGREKLVLKLFRMGRFVRARAVLEEKLLPNEPNSFVGRFVMAYILRHQEGELVRSLRYLREAIALFKVRTSGSVPSRSHHVMMIELIYSLRQLGRDRWALRLIDEHDRLYKHTRVLLEDLKPWSLMKLRRYNEATKLSLHYLSRKKYVTSALNALCAITFEQGRRVASLRFCRQAFVEDQKLRTGDKTTHRVNLAEAHLGVFQLDDAERYALEATQYFTPALHTNPWEFLTYVYLEQGRLNQAFNALRQAKSWKDRQLPHLKESMFTANQLSQGNFWIAVGDVERALRALELVRDRPDRHGHTSSEPRQQSVGAHVMMHHARLMKIELMRERAAAQTWWERFKNWCMRVVERFAIWQDGSMARRQLAGDLRLLRNTISPYRSGGATMPYWLMGDVVRLVGPAVVREQLQRLRAREQKSVPAIKPFFDALEAEAAFQQGAYTEAMRLSKVAFNTLPLTVMPLKMRMLGIRAYIYERWGQNARMRVALEKILQKDGTVIRRMGLSIPIQLSASSSPDVQAIADAMLRSPRFHANAQGFRVSIQDQKSVILVSISSPKGTNIVRAIILRKPKEKPDAFLKRALEEVHQSAFSHKTNFARKDASSLDDSLIGTPSGAIPWQEMLNKKQP